MWIRRLCVFLTGVMREIGYSIRSTQSEAYEMVDSETEIRGENTFCIASHGPAIVFTPDCLPKLLYDFPSPSLSIFTGEAAQSEVGSCFPLRYTVLTSNEKCCLCLD